MDHVANKQSTGLQVIFVLVVLVLLATWLVAFNGYKEVSPEQIRANVLQRFEPTPINTTYKFLTYNNPIYGFAVQYPVGFIALDEGLDFSTFKAYASVPGELPEQIEVMIDNTTTASEVFQTLLSSSETTGQTSSQRVYSTQSGKLVRLLITETDSPLVPEISNETATLYQAVYDCKDLVEQNQYVAFVLITIPKSLNLDKPIAQHTIETFKC